MLTDYIAPDRELGQHATEREISQAADGRASYRVPHAPNPYAAPTPEVEEVDRRFAADLAAQASDHERHEPRECTDALGRRHKIVLLQRTYASRAPYTAEIEWAWGGKPERIGTHYSQPLVAMGVAVDRIGEQALADGAESMASAMEQPPAAEFCAAWRDGDAIGAEAEAGHDGMG